MCCHNRFSWRLSSPREEQGIVVGSDINQEWILPWWWACYCRYNTYPVSFIDFGMSAEKKDWCRQRGELVVLQGLDDFVKDFHDLANDEGVLDPVFAEVKNTAFGKQFWDLRSAWFKKPFACLQTPFRKTLWIDIDCEISGSLQPVFGYAEKAPGLAMARDQNVSAPYPMYNSGVIAYRHGEPLMAAWARQCFECNRVFRGDQEVFSHMLAKQHIHIFEIPAIYNWTFCNEGSCNAVILHWYGVRGKFFIRNQIERSQDKLCTAHDPF